MALPLLQTLTIKTPARPVLQDAAKSGDVPQLTLALDEPGCMVDGKKLGYAAVHLAAKGGHLEALALLLDRGSSVNMRASNGMTPLHCAAENDQTSAMSMLLSRGGVLHGFVVYSSGDTVLHHAALNGRISATKLLVSKGADVHAKNTHGNTPRDDAVMLGRGRCPCEDPTAREWGAVSAFLEHVMPMAAAEREAFAQRAWERPEAAMLHDAAELGDCARLARLLESGADLDCRDYDGSSSVHAAVEGGHATAVSLLLDARADVRAANNLKESPLHVAAKAGDVSMCRLLVGRGADVHATNRSGATPCEYARRHQHAEWEAVAAFLDAEAKDMDTLDPAGRALRKIRVAMLDQRHKAPLPAFLTVGRAAALTAPTGAAPMAGGGADGRRAGVPRGIGGRPAEPRPVGALGPIAMQPRAGARKPLCQQPAGGDTPRRKPLCVQPPRSDTPPRLRGIDGPGAGAVGDATIAATEAVVVVSVE